MDNSESYKIKKFIEENKDLINENTSESWIEVYNNATRLPLRTEGMFTSMILDIGIDPASIMKRIPKGYLYQQQIDYKIPENVKIIEEMAFFECKKLIDVVIPNTVLSISAYAFLGCSNLTSVVIGENVNSIGDYVFYNCIRLTNVTIPNGVTSIGFQAFHNCRSLKIINIPPSVTSIGDEAFSGCKNLQRIIYNGTVKQWSYIRLGNNIFLNSKNITIECSDGEIVL